MSESRESIDAIGGRKEGKEEEEEEDGRYNMQCLATCLTTGNLAREPRKGPTIHVCAYISWLTHGRNIISTLHNSELLKGGHT